jgi:ATP-dependent protease ClpP protease subunit
MPLPRPKPGESQAEFVRRCASAAYSEADPGKSDEARSKQAAAMCFNIWREERGADAMANDILLYDDIGEGESSAKAVLMRLQAMKPTDPVTVGIFSYGGSFFEGEAIYAALKRHRGRVTVRIDGVAASAASYIAMAGDEIVMAPGSHMMIHRASVAGFLSANEDDLRDILARFETMNKQMVRVYAQRSGQDEAKVREMMQKDHWLTAEQCAQLGFCDRIDDELDVRHAASASDLGKFGYRHVPVAVKALTCLTTRAREQQDDDAGADARQQQPEMVTDLERARRARWKRRHAIMAAHVA